MMDWSGPSKSGLVVTTPTQEDLFADLTERMKRGEGFTVATINLDHAVKLRRDARFLQAYKAHSHVVADGNPIVWLSRLSGQAGVKLVPGSDITAPAVALAARENVPVALFGSTDATLSEAATALREANPGLNIVAQISPVFGFDPDGLEAEEAIARLAASGARLVLLALGAPKQEVFAARAAERMPQAGFLSIGASLDFLAGSQTRAPAWVRRFAMEWLWRLLTNPSRLALRYGACFAILPSLTVRAFKTRLASGPRLDAGSSGGAA